MILKILSENTSNSDKYTAEHGLSIYIETDDKKILFDTGASSLFFDNANTMGVDLSSVHYLFISHGHNDHTGGLKKFLEVNDSAEVFMHKNAFCDLYSKKEGIMHYIGTDKSLKDNKRIIYIDDYFHINDEIEILTDLELIYPMLESNHNLYAKQNDKPVQDTFDHEMHLVIQENKKHYLFTGCAHKGIQNILHAFEKAKGVMPDFIIGGLHLKGLFYDKKEFSDIATFMKQSNSTFYTGHCTGASAFFTLKKELNDKIQYIRTGDEISLI